MKRVNIRDVSIFIILLILGLISFKYASLNISLMEIFLITQVPIFFGGFFLDAPLALLLGLITPIAASYIFKFPVLFPDTLLLSFEYLTFGFVASKLNKKRKLSVLLSLFISMIIGRIISGIMVFIMVITFQIQNDPIRYVENGIINSWPGIILQLVLIPAIMHLFNHYTTINLE